MKWTFQQIEGPVQSRKRLELSGWNAPFGRPRQGPVVRELIRSRIQTTRYPGSNKQTRHAFGTNWESMELRGRWMTKELQQQGITANEMANRWTEFVQDERTCRIAWGFIVSYIGFIEELELGRESEDEIAWRMKLEIDEREDVATRFAISKNTPAADNLAFIETWVRFSEKLKEPVLPDISPDFLESLDNLARDVNQFSAELNKLAGRFDEIEKASFATIQHFRGAITGMRTALVTMRDTIVSAGIDSVMLVRTAESDIAWVRYQTDFDAVIADLLDQLNAADRRAELAAKNEAKKLIQAKEGDTWESLSTRATGGPEKAGMIRLLNGARFGELPEPGVSYLVQ